jgi:hypothetical protein
MRRIGIPFLTLLCCFPFWGAGGLGALDIRADFTFKPEYHRSFGYCQEFAAAGEAVFKESYTAQGGIALGQTGKEFDLDMFLGAAYRLPLPVNLRIRLLYLYNNIPGYTYQANSLFPGLSYQGKWGGADLGTILRFTVFDAEPPIFEPILGFRFFVIFPALGPVRLLAGVENFSVFNMGNLGAYYLFLEGRIDMNGFRPVSRLREKWARAPLVSLISNLSFYQTGSIGFTSAFQGFSWQGGLSLSW